MRKQARPVLHTEPLLQQTVLKRDYTKNDSGSPFCIPSCQDFITYIYAQMSPRSRHFVNKTFSQRPVCEIPSVRPQRFTSVDKDTTADTRSVSNHILPYVERCCWNTSRHCWLNGNRRLLPPSKMTASTG